VPTSVQIPSILILLLTLACVVLLITGFHKALRNTGCWPDRALTASILLSSLIAVWMMLVGILAESGFFSKFAGLPPRLLFALIVPGIALMLIWRTQTFKAVLEHTPVAWLIYLQTFRIAVELLLWNGYRGGALPVEMTLVGRNFDILAGLTAPVVGLIWQRTHNQILGIVWNFVGLALLLNIVVIAILSMPTPLRVFTDGPPNVLLSQFPFIYLPAILVPLAYTAHILSLRQLLRPRSPERFESLEGRKV
jgi:hypothetical protein